MLNLFQHLIESNTYETLNQVQGDKKGFTTKPLGREEGMGDEGVRRDTITFPSISAHRWD